MARDEVSQNREGSMRARGGVYVVGIAGGTGSGKTTLAREIMAGLGEGRAALISHDAYYRDFGRLPLEERSRTNFDHPDSLETSLLVAHIDALRRGETVEVPAYDFGAHTRRKDAGVKVAPRPVVIVEGILIFADEALRGRMDLKIFVEADADLRFGRRIERDIRERGRSLTSVMEQYMKTVRPMHERFVEPSRRHADVILKGEGDNRAAVSLIVAHLNACVSHSP